MNNLPEIIKLTAWEGFQSRQGPYTSIDSDLPSDGTVQLQIGGTDLSTQIKTAHIKAYEYLIEHQVEIKDKMLQKIFTYYKDYRKEFADDFSTKEEADEYIPEVTTVEEFKQLIGLAIVHILNKHKDGVAFVGFEFGCKWDEEHGLGVRMHKDRIIGIGGADKAFDH